MKQVKVGLIGWGTIGVGVSRILLERPDLIEEKVGVPIRLVRIADLDISTPRGIQVDRSMLTTDAEVVLNDPEIDVVIELIGGIEPAKSFILKAIRSGKHVVTANKALLAQHASELFSEAYKAGVNLYFEGSVGGGIPIIKSLREGLLANRIRSIYGIINGTANYILTKMTEEGSDFQEALGEAQRNGYAEADPTYDVEGYDAAHKITILSSLAYGGKVKLDDVYVEGITKVTPKDIQYAGELGYVIKLLAISKFHDGRAEVRVHPTLLPQKSMLASVRGVFNGIYVVGDAVGATMFYGQGAGRMPTASAVTADIVDIARRIISKAPPYIPLCWRPDSPKIDVMDIEECESRYYVRYIVVDRAGVLAQISGILGRHNISIASVIQKESYDEESVYLVMMTHKASERAMRQAMEEIDRLDVVRAKSMVIRVEMEE